MIEQTVVEQIAGMIDQTGPNTETLAVLRKAFSGLHFTYCLDDDVSSARPVLMRTGYNLYLVDGSDHCLNLTSSLERATGVVMAEIIDDD